MTAAIVTLIVIYVCIICARKRKRERERESERENLTDEILMSIHIATKAYKSRSFLLLFMLLFDHIPIEVNVPDIPGLDPPDRLVCRYTVTTM